MVEEQRLSDASGLHKPKYRLGKITNKYIILEIYSLAYITREEATYRMFKQDRSTRNLLIEQYYLKVETLLTY